MALKDSPGIEQLGCFLAIPTWHWLEAFLRELIFLLSGPMLCGVSRESISVATKKALGLILVITEEART